MGKPTRRHGPVTVLPAAAAGLAILFAMAPPPSVLAQNAPESSIPAAAPASVRTFSLAGQVSLQSSARFDTAFAPFFSFRAIPELEFTTARSAGPNRRVTVDAEVSVNAYGSAVLVSDAPADLEGDIRPYRAWLRLTTPRFEARIGLQKVSFGSATLFRPMMWFDSLDPRDPLQLTDGVYALLLRYYTQGNANFWAWTMYGNDAVRGFDLAPPDKRTPEFGGRIQVPLFKGEIAVTYHHRKAAIDGLTPVMDPLPPDASPLPVEPVPEDRVGLDAKWDIGAGLWLEGALVHQRTTLLPAPYQLSLAGGLDYTFGLGRGLYALAEHFRLEASAAAFAAGQARSVSALLFRYPLGLSDELTAILYYDWTNDALYKFLAWKRTADAVSFSVIAFWNPETVLLPPGQPGSSSFAGPGLQLVLAYYF
jgi:hypothetical protein